MRYIIYTFCYETPHFETDLEIAKSLIIDGHEVFFLTCNEELKSCFINPNHNKFICGVCKSKIKNGIEYLKTDKQQILSFKLRDFPVLGFDNITTIQDLSKFSYKGCDIGLGVISSLVSATRDHLFDIVQHKDKIFDGLQTSILVYENFKSIIESYKPDGVILFNGRFLETKPVIHLCKAYGVKFYTHERGGQVDRFMFRENSTPHSLDFARMEIDSLWVNGGEEKYKIGERFFEERKNKVQQNWFVYTNNQVENKLPINFNKSKINIAIFNSSIDEYVAIPDFINKIYKDDNDGIRRLCESFKDNQEVHFYLRNHPNLKNLDTSQTREINSFKNIFNNLTIIESTDDIDSYYLMESVDMIVTFGSTMGVEALYWGTPSLLLGEAYYSTIGGLLKPNTHEEACVLISKIEKLNSNEKDVNRGNALKFGYWSLMYGEPFRYFKPSGLFQGTFTGDKISANVLSRVLLKSYMFFRSFKIQ
jgi:hypothetical protein